MIIETNNNRQVFLRRLNSNDLDNLFDYLQNLSGVTKMRFAYNGENYDMVLDIS